MGDGERGRAVIGLVARGRSVVASRARWSTTTTVKAREWLGRASLSGTTTARAAATIATTKASEDEESENAYFKAGDTSLDGKIPPPPRTSNLTGRVAAFVRRCRSLRRGTAWRLAAALTFLMIQKSFGLAVPILFKVAVDHCTTAAAASGAMAAEAARAAAMALVASGALKAMSGVATELRTVFFTPVAQASGRRVALEVFNHVLSLDLSFHLERRTGALQRIIDRGTRSVSMVFRAVVFTFLPTAIELSLVCGLLWHAFSWHFVVIVLAAFVARMCGGRCT